MAPPPVGALPLPLEDKFIPKIIKYNIFVCLKKFVNLKQISIFCIKNWITIKNWIGQSWLK